MRKSQDFEQTLTQLETIVQRLESGNLPLEDALKNFEEGIKLAQAAKTKLQQAEQQIQILLQKSSTAPLQEFNPDDIDDRPF